MPHTVQWRPPVSRCGVVEVLDNHPSDNFYLDLETLYISRLSILISHWYYVGQPYGILYFSGEISCYELIDFEFYFGS